MKRLRYSSKRHPYYKTYNYNNQQKIKGWWIKEPPENCFTIPEPTNLADRGWIQVFCCFLFCSPCCCFPCFLSCNYNGYQFPDYDDNLNENNNDNIPIAVPIPYNSK
jgi:hypothetical protein